MEKIPFRKMSGAGNVFVVIDVRQSAMEFSPQQIQKISDRKNIGCDQFILIKNSQNADCFMDIYNSDGSSSGACGNATRCVASIIMQEKNKQKVKIETASGVLPCKKVGDEIAVEMGVPNVLSNNFYFDDLKFYCVDIGNPHAITFVENIPCDEEFFKVGKEVEKHEFFPKKTNVEFARIVNDEMIEIRVFERGVGETMACGTGACAVVAAAIKNKMVKKKKVIARFKGGDLTIEWKGDGKKVVMSGDFKTLYKGKIDEKFL